MLRRVNWLARATGYVWIGIVAFAFLPPHQTSAVWLQAASFAVLGLALVAWAVLDLPRSAHRVASELPVVLGVMSAASGLAGGIGGGGTSCTAFTAVAAMMAGSELPLASALAVTAVGVLGTEVGSLLYSGGWGNYVGLPAVVLAGLVVGRNRGAYRIQAEQAAALLVQRADLAAEQRRADLLDERTRIAREIHDVLAHSLGALGIQIQAARAVLTDRGDVGQASALLATAQQMASEGLVETRRAIQALRTDRPPLDEELAQLTETHAQRFRVAVDFAVEGAVTALAPDASLALLRTAQEALVNAAKHAPGRPVTLRLAYDAAQARLTVRNDIDGVADRDASITTVDGGYGLTGMRERLQLLGGTLAAGPRGPEWVVTAAVPARVESMAP